MRRHRPVIKGMEADDVATPDNPTVDDRPRERVRVYGDDGTAYARAIGYRRRFVPSGDWWLETPGQGE